MTDDRDTTSSDAPSDGMSAGGSRTYEWSDPAVLSAHGATMSGLEFLTAMITGELPLSPIFATLDFWPVEVSEGRMVFGARPQSWQYNPIGSIHGGIACTLLDSAMGCAVHSMLPRGVGYTSLDVSVRFVRGIAVDTGELRIIGEIQHVGRRTATASAQILNADGKVFASGTTTCLILR